MTPEKVDDTKSHPVAKHGVSLVQSFRSHHAERKLTRIKRAVSRKRMKDDAGNLTATKDAGKVNV